MGPPPKPYDSITTLQTGRVLVSPAVKQPKIHFQRAVEVAAGPTLTVGDQVGFHSAVADEHLHAYRWDVSGVALFVQIAGDDEVFHALRLIRGISAALQRVDNFSNLP